MFDLPPKAKNILKHPYKNLGLILLVGLLLYFGIVNPVLNKIEKNSFEEAYTHIEGLANDMQSAAGQAEKLEVLKSCGYSGQTFDRGWRSCSVTIDMAFPSFDLQKSNDYFLTVSKLISDEPQASVYNDNQTKFEEIDYYRQIFTQSFYYKNIYCQTEYEYNDISKQEVRVPETENGLYVEIICFKEARAEHYPVID